MKPLSEEPRFPRLNTLLAATIPLTLSITLACWINASLLSDGTITGAIERIIQTTKLIAIAIGVPVLGVAIFTPLIILTINHLTGRDHFGGRTTASSMFATAYAISENYVLPYVHNFVNKRDEHFCDLYLSFSYAEILHIYQTLKKRHRLTYQFHTLSLPNHLGRRTPLLTRAGTEQLLRDMTDSANAAGSNVEQQRAVLLYSFWPNCPSYIDLPYHQAFISRDVIRDLIDLIATDPNLIHGLPSIFDADLNYTLPAYAEVSAYYDAEHVIALSAGYLRTTYTRIAAEDELVYLPISPA